MSGRGLHVAVHRRAGAVGTRRGRLTALDGIRAFAVLSVMAFHFGVPGTGGGLLGVDIFFVLSGFLITSLLVREYGEHQGIGLRSFWGRRARRLLPALFVTLAGVAAYAHYFASSVDLASLRADALSTLFYVANWHFIASNQGYFAASAAPSPLLHTWSLGVEEQYYLIWPLVALFVLRRFGLKGLAVTAGVGALASAGLMGGLHLAGASVDRLYYGTDTRAQALLVGSFLGAVGRPGTWTVLPESWLARAPVRRLGPVVGVAGALFLLWACHAFDGQDPVLYLGGFLLVSLAAGAVITAVVTWPGSPLARLLSFSVLTYVGRISYGLYLYHWPLFLVIDHAHTGLSGLPLLAARLGATFALAIASFHLLEEPIRRHRLLPSWQGAAAALVAASLTVGALVVVTETPAVATAVSGATTVTAAERTQLRAEGAFGAHPLRFVITGDSLAVTLSRGLKIEAGNHYGLKVIDAAALGCDLDPTLQVMLANQVGPATPGCPHWRTVWPAMVARERPDVVGVLLGRWEVADHDYQGHWVHVGEPVWDDHVVAEMNQAVRIFSARGAKVVLFTMPYVDPVDGEAPDGTTYSENLPSRVDDYNRLVARVARDNPGVVTVVNLNELLDPAHHYQPVLDGITVRWSDGIHISLAGGEWLQPKVLPTVVQLALAAQPAVAAAPEHPPASGRSRTS